MASNRKTGAGDGATSAPGAPGGTEPVMGTRGLRVLMTTEGTYPYLPGGVTNWCRLLVAGLPDISWQVLPLTAGRHQRRDPRQLVPENVTVLPAVELWSESPPGGRPGRLGRPSLPGDLARGLLAWNGPVDLAVDAFVRCRQHPTQVRRIFRSGQGWDLFISALREVLEDRPSGVSSVPELSMRHVATLYQSLYWMARTAAVPTPRSDVLLVTAAGWSAIPALVHRRLHGTPMLLVEHGVYVRESYLAASKIDPASRFVETRIARGLTLAAYAGADLVNPVQGANAAWEEGLGVEPRRICTIPNGMSSQSEATPLPRNAKVVAMGRLDPLKDIHTLLRTAAAVAAQHADAQFLHYGPYSLPPDTPYGRSCMDLHERLGLGDRFRFMGFAPSAAEAVRSADVIIMTSISEGFPMSLLEAMAEARPVVTTWVGGIPEVIRGCGFLTPPGDVDSLAAGVVTLLRDLRLAETLGRRGHARLARRFSDDNWLPHYRELLQGMADGAAA